jgi:hypothetical protein
MVSRSPGLCRATPIALFCREEVALSSDSGTHSRTIRAQARPLPTRLQRRVYQAIYPFTLWPDAPDNTRRHARGERTWPPLSRYGRGRLPGLECPVERGPADAEHRRHLGDGVRAAPVRTELVGELPCELHLIGAHSEGTPPGPPAGTGRGQSLERVLHDQLAPELVDRAEHMEHQAALRSGGGVDALLEHLEVDAALGEVGGTGR